MTWQHWAVVAEMWFSVILLSILVDRGHYRGEQEVLLWMPWDLVFLGLFVWGCTHQSWQATVYIVFMVMGLILGVKASSPAMSSTPGKPRRPRTDRQRVRHAVRPGLGCGGSPDADVRQLR
jgi:hypothetical protein